MSDTSYQPKSSFWQFPYDKCFKLNTFRNDLALFMSISTSRSGLHAPD